ncbi:unnamed protein product [Amoebophrya sp. A25]|nr:unnamed protein product [Amoebophrya sp. A25]|eukprot:GSA25T00014067001.1
MFCTTTALLLLASLSWHQQVVARLVLEQNKEENHIHLRVPQGSRLARLLSAIAKKQQKEEQEKEDQSRVPTKAEEQEAPVGLLQNEVHKSKKMLIATKKGKTKQQRTKRDGSVAGDRKGLTTGAGRASSSSKKRRGPFDNGVGGKQHWTQPELPFHASELNRPQLEMGYRSHTVPERISGTTISTHTATDEFQHTSGGTSTGPPNNGTSDESTTAAPEDLYANNPLFDADGNRIGEDVFQGGPYDVWKGRLKDMGGSKEAQKLMQDKSFPRHPNSEDGAAFISAFKSVFACFGISVFIFMSMLGAGIQDFRLATVPIFAICYLNLNFLNVLGGGVVRTVIPGLDEDLPAWAEETCLELGGYLVVGSFVTFIDAYLQCELGRYALLSGCGIAFASWLFSMCIHIWGFILAWVYCNGYCNPALEWRVFLFSATCLMGLAVYGVIALAGIGLYYLQEKEAEIARVLQAKRHRERNKHEPVIVSLSSLQDIQELGGAGGGARGGAFMMPNRGRSRPSGTASMEAMFAAKAAAPPPPEAALDGQRSGTADDQTSRTDDASSRSPPGSPDAASASAPGSPQTPQFASAVSPEEEDSERR